MEINVSIDKGLERHCEVSWVQNIAEQVLVAQGIDPRTELGLLITTQEKIQQLQMLQQSMQQFLMQKQQFQAQLVEIESALKELEKTDSAYKIVGSILVGSDKADLKKDLEEKKKVLDLRIKSLYHDLRFLS